MRKEPELVGKQSIPHKDIMSSFETELETCKFNFQKPTSQEHVLLKTAKRT